MKHNFNRVKKSTLELSNDIESCGQSEYIFYHQELTLNGDLDLEYLYENFEEGANGLYVEGDLKVNGNIFGGTSVYLYVGGDLYVDSLYVNADDVKVHIEGNLYVKHFLITDQENYYFEVNGEIYNQIRIDKSYIDYTDNKLKNTNFIFMMYEFEVDDLWYDIIENDDNRKKFIETYKDFDENKYNTGCPAVFIRKYWDFYQKFGNVFLLQIIEEKFFDGMISNDKVSEKTFNAVLEYIKSIGGGNKPLDEDFYDCDGNN